MSKICSYCSCFDATEEIRTARSARSSLTTSMYVSWQAYLGAHANKSRFFRTHDFRDEIFFVATRFFHCDKIFFVATRFFSSRRDFCRDEKSKNLVAIMKGLIKWRQFLKTQHEKTEITDSSRDVLGVASPPWGTSSHPNLVSRGGQLKVFH